MFIRSKVISGKNYFYLVENKRDGNKIVQKVIRYLGTTKPSAEILVGDIFASPVANATPETVEDHLAKSSELTKWPNEEIKRGFSPNTVVEKDNCEIVVPNLGGDERL